MPQRIKEVRIESTDNVAMSGAEIQVVTGHIEALDAVVPLTEAAVTTLGPLQYRYRLEFADGRTWTQIITQAVGTDLDPHMTFAVPAPGLKLSEFANQRELRAAIISMIATRGLITLIYEFN